MPFLVSLHNMEVYNKALVQIWISVLERLMYVSIFIST